MAYSSSKLTVQRIRPRLKRLEAGHECRWETPAGKADLFAYKIREALYIAKTHYPQDFPALAKAATNFEIVATKGKYVTARRKWDGEVSELELTIRAEIDEPPVEVMTNEEEAAYADEAANEAGDLLTVDGHQTQFTIIATWTQNRYVARLSFPDAELSEHSLTMLYNWAEKQSPRLMIIAIPPEPGITLAPHDEDMEEIRWKPTTT